jgi:membrane protease YdiL (CAAX protease family)
MDTQTSIDPAEVLQQWRTKILNGFLIIVAVAATAMTAASIADAISRPGQWSAVIVFAVLDVVLIALAIFQVDYRIRAWGVLLVPYVVGVTPAALLKTIEERLRQFVGTADPFDDLTLLAVKRDS